MEKSIFYVNEEDTGARLDQYLASEVSTSSRSVIQKNIKDGNVKVNDKVRKPS